MNVPADVMLAVRTSRSLILAFLVGCLVFGVVLVVVPTGVVVSAITAGSAGTAVSVVFIAAGVKVSAGLGVGVLCLILKRGACVCGWIVVWVGPSPGYPRVWLCLGRGCVRCCCAYGLSDKLSLPLPPMMG